MAQGDDIPGDFDMAYRRIERVRALASARRGYPVRVASITSVSTVDVVRLLVSLTSGERFHTDIDMDVIDPIEERTAH